ncbi:RHS repeat domain-containing protein [Xanthomonas melonis]|uniref:Type IV secretion protein Rhs n=1 Tax=Xanthomonas melonis TaxID=56456 RepID=A0A2S7DBJ0_9XANT|nr:RHS repeat domain-containing protein [Xanthomonas melonis]MCC4601675.1 RHS repeat protein [Xanthomonas melonis]PPU71167.1 type IV secretion protein Rhs [Xanthomonas melonis]
MSKKHQELLKLSSSLASLLCLSTAQAQNYTKTETLSYYDDTSKWVLGQTSRVVVDGITTSEVAYGANAQPVATRNFGKLQQTLTYNGDGTIATVTDGNGNTTVLSGWMRGIPQSIRHADGSSESAIVNDNGWLTSVTDENGYSTSYGYDAMGRISSISYPQGDSTAWNSTAQAFELVMVPEYGIGAGHWRQTIATGNYRKLTYFDALWRPLLTREFDAANEAATQRFQRFTYDHEGRVTFASYPGSSDALTTGTWTEYDALGRTISVGQDTELDTKALLTFTEYLPGNKTRVRSPNEQATVTGYQVFDQPAYDKPVLIQHPEGAVTEISRDVFGKPTAITRHSNDWSQVLTRTYAYNSNQELCRTVEPETGATLTGYDGAGNIRWSAAGLPMDIGCDASGTSATIAARRVDRGYDARNRVVSMSFPDSNGNQRFSYWPDGLTKQITTQNNGVATYNSYAYNKRRLLTGESQGQADGETWAMSSIYDANASLAAHRYPTGQTIDYAPNALGQPTRAGAYASTVSYYPNGAIRQFTYGNGILHTMTQNRRQLPATSQDTHSGIAVLSDSYTYDKNGNVKAIADNASWRNGRGNRSMEYDGLDRLKSASSPMFGNAVYAYDALDNLTKVAVSGRDHWYCYDPYWHLTNIKTGGSCSGGTVIGLAYDLQGNLVNKNGQTYAFDFGNRLRSATNKETYRYDGNGRRTLATQSGGGVASMYDQGGVLRFQKNQRSSKTIEYVVLGGSNIAEVEWPLGYLPAMKDTLTWGANPGAVRYIVEESIDRLTWTSVYEGDQTGWTSLSRPSGTYSYRVLGCTQNGVCSEVFGVSHVKRSAMNIVPLLYQLLLN